MVFTGPASWFLGLVSGLCRFSSLGEARCGSGRLCWLVMAVGLCRFCLLGELRRGLELAIGSNCDSVWLGLSFDFGGGVEFPLGNLRCRVAGNGRIARGLALEEIRWDAASRFFLSFVFLRRRGCLRARGSYGRLLSGEIRVAGGGEDV
jgi:hypothetical protein